MNRKTCRTLSTICFYGGLISILLSIGTWWYLQSADAANQAYAERFGIFIGLWAPTFLILSNRFDRYADKARDLAGLNPEHHEENLEEADPERDLSKATGPAIWNGIPRALGYLRPTMNSGSSYLKAAVVGAGLLALFFLTSCNTVSGLGRDIENAGNAMENATTR